MRALQSSHCGVLPAFHKRLKDAAANSPEFAMSTEAVPIGLIIVSHGQYAKAILHTAESLLGPQTDCVTISVDAAHVAEETVRRLHDAANLLDKGEGVIVLTDMFGGTPTNIALSLQGKHKAEVITGINLPMILKVLENRASETLAELARKAEEAGKAGIVGAGRMLRQKKQAS